MRRILITTHGEFAGGLKQMMDFVLGGNDKVEILNAYTTPDFDMDREVAAVMDGAEEGDELIVLTDVLGGSVSNAFSRQLSRPGIYVLAGVNAPMLLAMVPMLDSAMATEELIRQGMQSARDGCVFINDRMKRISEEREEDCA